MSFGNLAALTDQRNDEIVVLDLDAKDLNDPSAAVWSWNAFRAGDVDYPNRSNHRPDDAKLRRCEAWGGDVVGITSSSGLIALVSYPSGVCLFNDDAAGFGPHSIEILPNGLIAAACSGNGNAEKSQLRLYPALSKRDSAFVFDPFPGAHGVLWDPEKEVLWALGDRELRAYAVAGTREAPRLIRRPDLGTAIPGGGHDLSPVIGDCDRLWITYGQGVGQYVKSENAVLHAYAGSDVIDVRGCKSINSFPDGTVVWTVEDPKNKTAGHDTNVLNLLSPAQEVRQTEIPSRDFYKARAFVPDYQ